MSQDLVPHIFASPKQEQASVVPTKSESDCRHSRSTVHQARIQHRRELLAKIIQRVQSVIQSQIGSSRRLPWLVRLLEAIALPRRLRTRFISAGFRPEHVRTCDVFKIRSFDRWLSAVAERKKQRMDEFTFLD